MLEMIPTPIHRQNNHGGRRDAQRTANSSVWTPSQLLWLALVLLGISCLASSASAQISNATINGTVRDQSGNVVVNATVTATNAQTGIRKGETTDDTGRYTINNLVPGIYEIEAAQTGFATILRHNQELLVGTTITLDFSLPVTSVSQTVEVQAEGPVQQTTQNTVQQIMQTKQLDNLPLVTRSFSDLAALTPGVLVGVGSVSSANISINQRNGSRRCSSDWCQYSLLPSCRSRL
jgi:hypothetical protein